MNSPESQSAEFRLVEFQMMTADPPTNETLLSFAQIREILQKFKDGYISADMLRVAPEDTIYGLHIELFTLWDSSNISHD